jgi:uncharacterized membrane protein YvlD (DUF360 family)
MNLTLPPKVRQTIYIVTAIASPVMLYLSQTQTVSDFVYGLFAVVVTAVTSLAAVNVSKS